MPIILFCIYFKLQAPKDEQSYSYPGPTKHQYSRGKILSRRKYVDLEEKPETLSNLCLKSQGQAPELFVSTGRPGRGGGGGGGGGKRDERPPRAERGDRGDRGERGDKRGSDRQKKGDKKEEKEEVPVAEAFSVSEEKMHLESLLNYVAFNKRAVQRTFLPEEGTAPPPPPKRLRPGHQPKPPGDDDVSGATAEKANAEAQMVLRGAMSFKSATVAKDLYDQLMDSQVEITERTFTLMIEGCVLASDLKSASDFLMKMETSGYCPESELLDKVMDLYSQQKSLREQEKQLPPAPEEVPAEPEPAPPIPPAPAASPSVEEPIEGLPDEEDRALEGILHDTITEPAETALAEEDAAKTRLSSDAPIFVPSFSPAPAAPPAAAAPNDETEEPEQRTSLRTKLVASAKPFEPQFNVTFDPTMYTWTVDQPEESANDDPKGKGKDVEGKGKGKESKGGKGKKECKEGKADGKVSAKAKKDADDGEKGKSKESSDKKDGKKTGAPKWKPK